MKIRFYGSLSEAIGREVELEAPRGVTVAEVRRTLAEIYPNAADILCRPSTRACVDGAIVGEEAVADRNVEFFPPLSGG